MKVPSSYYQLCSSGGFVFDISEATWEMLKAEIRDSGLSFLQFEDIYGSPSEIRPEAISCVRHFSPEASQLYAETHRDEGDETGGRFDG